MSASQSNPEDGDALPPPLWLDGEIDDNMDPDYDEFVMDYDAFGEDGDDEFHDAVEDAYDDDGDPVEADAARSQAQRMLLDLESSTESGLLSRQQMIELIRSVNVGDVITAPGFNIDGDGRYWASGRTRGALDPDRFPKVPSEEGQKLMDSGSFGASDLRAPPRYKQQKEIARRVLDREMGLGDEVGQQLNQKMMAQSLIPSSEPEMIISYYDPVYSGQFSDDGNFFYACVKDFKVRMYDTANPHAWRHYKTVSFPYGHWTLTDATLSPDNKWLAYTSISTDVCLAPTDPNDLGDPYMMCLGAGARPGAHPTFGIWSVRFSGDGRELVAGTNVNTLIVFDIESRRVLHSIRGHSDDVNAVCFADKSSPHILYSGSDDATIKVWDRRSMGERREAGAFLGHLEGITYIDSKGDGRYILSNAKDQSMKLWDLRKSYSSAEFRELNKSQWALTDYDYRGEEYNDDDWYPHPKDNSVVTFRGGHKVRQTLIRCHFSPPGSTDSRYVYTGSYDGKVWIYNMDATVAATLDVQEATRRIRTASIPFLNGRIFHRRVVPSACVRDASWHPKAPFIAASVLKDHMNSGVVTLHSFDESMNDEPQTYDDRMKPDPMPDSHGTDDEDEDGEWEEDEGEYEEE